MVESLGQVAATTDSEVRLRPTNAGWLILDSERKFVLRFESLSEEKEAVLLRAREELAKRAAIRRRRRDMSSHDRDTPVAFSKQEVDKIRRMICGLW